MDTRHAIDMGAVFKVIDSAEVIIFSSVTMPYRLLFHTGHNYIANRDAEIIREMETRERADVYKAVACAGHHNLWERTC